MNLQSLLVCQVTWLTGETTIHHSRSVFDSSYTTATEKYLSNPFFFEKYIGICIFLDPPEGKSVTDIDELAKKAQDGTVEQKEKPKKDTGAADKKDKISKEKENKDKEYKEKTKAKKDTKKNEKEKNVSSEAALEVAISLNPEHGKSALNIILCHLLSHASRIAAKQYIFEIGIPFSTFC